MANIIEIISYILLFFILYFQVFFLLSFFNDKKRKNWYKTPENKDYFPTTSIIVPCFNEEKTVSSTIDSLLSLDYPKDKLKIIAVNDGSTDSTLSILNKYKEKFGIVVLDKENGGKHTALNLALENIDTELVGCLDADSFVDKMALSKLVPYFKKEDIMAVIPAVVVHKPSNLLQLIQKAEYNIAVLVRRILCNLNAIYVPPGPFSIFRKKVFDTIGGYKHGHTTEDMEIAMRMQKHHMKIENSPESLVYTVTPKTISALQKQRVRWQYGFFKNALDYKSLFFKKEYGNFGRYVPFAYMVVFVSLYFFFFMIYNFISAIYRKILELSLVGFNLNFNWFFINTKVMIFLGLLLITTSIFILIASRKMVNEKRLLSKDIILFLFLYGFISPFWVMKAVYNVAMEKGVSWR